MFFGALKSMLKSRMEIKKEVEFPRISSTGAQFTFGAINLQFVLGEGWKKQNINVLFVLLNAQPLTT